MSDARPEPFVPADLDLRDFRWMKLDLMALFNSDFNATVDDTAWRAGVTLWGKAWHQVPACSLPNDDATLCSLAGLGRDTKTWKRIRPIAMRGWVECSDGRLYHAYLCKMATGAHEERQRKEHQKAADRARKARGNPYDGPPISDGIPPEQDGENTGTPRQKSERENRKEKKNPPTPQGASGGGLFDCEGVERWETSKRDGRSHPVVGDHYLDLVWDLVVDAAQINEQTWRSDLAPLIRWLKAGVEPDDICAVVRRMVRSDPTFRPFTLKPFDAAVMAHAKEAAA
jgi:hypothetical protein